MNGATKKDPSAKERSIIHKLSKINAQMQQACMKLERINAQLEQSNRNLESINPWRNPEAHDRWMGQQESRWLNSFGD